MIPQFSLEIEGLKEYLTDVSDDISTQLEIATDVAGAAIVKRLRENQLSGRRAYNLGLNRVTGNLYESLRNLTVQTGRKTTLEVYNRGAQYWYYHEFGLGHNPQRLWFNNDFETAGMAIWESEIDLALRVAA